MELFKLSDIEAAEIAGEVPLCEAGRAFWSTGEIQPDLARVVATHLAEGIDHSIDAVYAYALIGYIMDAGVRPAMAGWKVPTWGDDATPETDGRTIGRELYRRIRAEVSQHL